MSDFLPLPWPVKGLSDALAFADQPAGTCTDGVNVCNIDPITGRARGGSRSGTERYVETEVNGAEKVVDLASVERVNPRVTHDEHDPGSEVVEWSREMPSKGSCLAVRLDDQGNTISVDGGRALVKKNSAGVELWRIALPTSGEYDVVRALAVDIDTELGALVFAAVSDSTSMAAEPKMWCYRQLLDNKTEQVWEEEPGGFVAHLAVRDGVLYATVNDKETETAALKAWAGLGTANPVELWEKVIPYPARYNAVGKDGSTYVCSPANPLRNVNPNGVGGITKNLIDYTPNDLLRAKTRIWAWYSARNVDGQQNATMADGDPVTIWWDQSENGRHLGPNGSDPGPRFLAKGSTGYPSVHFDGTQAMAGQPGVTINALQANVNKSFLPGHSGGGYAVVALLRVTPRTVRQTFYQQGAITNAGAITHWTLLDTNQANVFAAGFGVAHEHEGTGTIGDIAGAVADFSGDGRYDREFPYGVSDLTENYVILTRVFTNGWGAGAGQESLWRMNGQPLDSWFSQALDYTWTQAAIIGTSVGTVLPGTFELMEMVVLREEDVSGVKRVLSYPDYPDATYGVGFGGTEVEQLEGYLAWGWGVSHLLPSGSAVAPTVPGDNDGNFPHAFRTTGGPPRTSGLNTASVVAQLFDDGPVLAKFAPGGTGNVRWVVTNPTGTNLGVGGIGYACEPNEEQTVVWSVGPKSTTAVAGPTTAQEIQTNAVVRKVVDLGETARVDIFSADPGPGAYVIGTAPGGPYGEFRYEYPKIDVYTRAGFGHLALALKEDDASPAQLLLFLVSDTDEMTPHNGGVDLPTSGDGHAVAIVQSVPETMNDQGIEIPETIYAGTARHKSATLTGTANVSVGDVVTTFDFTIPFSNGYAFNTVLAGPEQVLIGATLADSLANLRSAINLDPAGAGVVYDVGTPANVNLAAIASDATTLTLAAKNADTIGEVLLSESSAVLSWGPTALTPLTIDPLVLHKVSLVETVQVAGSTREVHVLAVCDGLVKRALGGAWVSPSGDGTLDPAARFVQSDDLNGKVYYTDGLTYLVYDSRANLGAGGLSAWTAEGSGEMPKGARLVVAWRGRIVLARTYDNPTAWFMSKVGNPKDFDYFPPEISADMAVAGTLSDIGTCPDIIQTMVPLSDDLLLFGGAGSFWLMRGDPANGGNFDLLTDEMGSAFGRPWCKDPYGTAWILGNRGGLFRVGMDGSWARVSEHRIDRRLSSIDFSAYHVRLVWDEDGRCVHILLCPFGAAGVVRHFRYEVTLDAFWEEEFGQPVTSAVLAEGDTEVERVVLLGCSDGIVRRLSRTAKDDDGARIWSRVTLGPITPPGSPFEVGFTRLQVALSDTESGAEITVQVSDRADVPGDPVLVGELPPGLSDTLPLRAKGAFAWLTITNAKAGNRWSYETGMAKFKAKGRKRVRRPATG